jgi:hypothetical protein
LRENQRREEGLLDSLFLFKVTIKEQTLAKKFYLITCPDQVQRLLSNFPQPIRLMKVESIPVLLAS